MPKLPDQRICVRAEDDTTFDRKVTCGVTVEGVFTMEVPTELQNSAYSLKDDRKTNPNKVELDSARGSLRIHAKKLTDCIDFLKVCATDYLKADEVTERVIVYRMSLKAAAWIDKAGGLHPNGEGDSYDDGGKWWEPKSKRQRSADGFHRVGTYAVGFAAEVFDRKTFKRSSGETVTWETVRDTKDQAIEALNSFVGLEVDPADQPGKYQVMPYSPAAAKFFVGILLGIARLAINIDDFFSDEKRLSAAIKNPALTQGLFLPAKTE